MAAEAQKRRRDEGGETTGEVLGAAIEVHRALGPGLFERTYEDCLCHELDLRGVPFRRQVPLALEYKGVHLRDAYRLDVLVREEVVVEIKAVEQLTSAHRAQLLTYLRVGGFTLGLLINFHVSRLPMGVVRLVLEPNNRTP